MHQSFELILYLASYTGAYEMALIFKMLHNQTRKTVLATYTNVVCALVFIATPFDTCAGNVATQYTTHKTVQQVVLGLVKKIS